MVNTKIIKPHLPAHRKGIGFIMKIRKNLLSYFLNLMNEEGDFAWYALGRQKVVMINDAAGIEHVFKSNATNYKKSHFYHVLRPMLGNSMLLSEGEIWRKQRRDSTPVFTPKNFEEIFPEMVGATEAMFRRWENRPDKTKPIDLNFETMWYTLDVLLRTLFHEERLDLSFNVQSAITTLLREAEGRVWRPINLPKFITFRLPRYKAALRLLNDTLNDLVRARRENQAYPEDLLSRLIKAHGLSKAEQRCLRDQVMTFLLAGHETTANGLVWACYYLSLHPDMQNKMSDEANKVIGLRSVKFADIKELVYSRQFFDEVLRIHPVVWTMSREAINNDLIPLDNNSLLEVPANSIVMLSPYAVHKRTKYWSNPEAFDPERFSPNNDHPRPNFSYFPFGGGPRLCIGIRFAQIESILALSMLTQRYELSLVTGQELQPLPNITLRPPGPMLFHIRKRACNQMESENKNLNSDEVKQEASLEAKCPFHNAA